MQSLIEDQEDRKELGILHLDSKVLRDTEVCFVVLLIGVDDFYIYNPHKVDR